MRRRTLALLALAAALAGCPLPQPLPEYKEGTSVTPPRILSDGISVDGVPANSQAVFLVPAGCTAPEPTYALSAQIHDTNNLEQVEARWFVNYHPAFAQYYRFWETDTIPPDVDPLILTRTVPPNDPATGAARPFVFKPYQYDPPAGADAPAPAPDSRANILRVVELVVSNGFDSSATAWPAAQLPMRTPMPGFETQVYRWVFLTTPETPGSCDPGVDPICVKCPQPPASPPP